MLIILAGASPPNNTVEGRDLLQPLTSPPTPITSAITTAIAVSVLLTGEPLQRNKPSD